EVEEAAERRFRWDWKVAQLGEELAIAQRLLRPAFRHVQAEHGSDGRDRVWPERPTDGRHARLAGGKIRRVRRAVRRRRARQARGQLARAGSISGCGHRAPRLQAGATARGMNRRDASWRTPGAGATTALNVCTLFPQSHSV